METFINTATKKYNENSNNQRFGQFLMNELWDARPDLYKKITGTSNDCFYQDSHVPGFYAWLTANW